MFSPQLPVPAGLGLSAVLVISGHQPDWCIRGRLPYFVVNRFTMLAVDAAA